MADPFADYDTACAALEDLRPRWHAENEAARGEGREPDPLLKMQWKGLQERVQQLREFWRSVDLTVDMFDDRYGFVDADGRGRGRRAGHRVLSSNNDGSVAEEG